MNQQTSKSSQKARHSLEDKLNREWRKVARLHERNQKLDDELTQFEQQCRAAIAESEEVLTDALILQVRRLMPFTTRKSLTQWQRHELNDWIQKTLDEIMTNPFADRERVDLLIEEIRQYLPPDEAARTANFFHGDDSWDDDISDDDNPFAQMDDEEYRTATDEILREHLGEESFSQFEKFREEYERLENERQGREMKLDGLLNKSAITTIFRRLANRLHPDREQEAALRKQRSEQMAKAALARDNRDIFTLFSMYEEHFGEAPLAILGESQEEVLALLRDQAESLRQQEYDTIHESPIRSFFYNRFYDRNQKRSQAKQREYCKHLREQTHAVLQCVESIRSVSTLKPYLEALYDQRQWECTAG